MSVAQALEQTQAMRHRIKQQQKEAGILWKIRALWTRAAMTPMPPLHTGPAAVASPANVSNSSMHPLMRSASDPVRSRPVSMSASLSASSSSLPVRLSRELGCELRISARHLASPSKLASGDFAPCIIVYGVQRKQTADAAATATAFKSKTMSGSKSGSDIRGAGFASGERAVFIGRTERISNAQCLSSSTVSSSDVFSFPSSSAVRRGRDGESAPLSLNPAHPNYLTVLTLTRLDEFDEFHLVVHDTADILAIEAAAAARHALSNSGVAHSSATGSAENSRTSSRIPSRRPSANRTVSGEANANATGAVALPSPSCSPAPLLFSLLSLQLCPIVGWCRFRSDDFLLNFGRELVSPLDVPGAPPSIALLTKHFIAPLPTTRSVNMLTKAASSAARNNTAARTSVDHSSGGGGGGGGGSSSDWLIGSSAGSASADLFVRDSEGRTLVTDAMLDAYQVAVFDREARREQKQAAAALATELAARQGSGGQPLSAMERQVSVAGSLPPLLAVRAQINPLLLLRVSPLSSLRSSQPARPLSGGVMFAMPGGLESATSAAASTASDMAAHESELRLHRRMLHRSPLIHASAHVRSLSLASDESSLASRRRTRRRPTRHVRRHTWSGFEAQAQNDKILIVTTAAREPMDKRHDKPGEAEEQQAHTQGGGKGGGGAGAERTPLSLLAVAAASSSPSSPLLLHQRDSVIEDLELEL